MTEQGAARLSLDVAAVTRIATGAAVLDHLLELLAQAGRFGLELEVAPDEPENEVEVAGAALGAALVPALDAKGASGRGAGIAAADEALAMVVVERDGTPLVASNADLSTAGAGGLRTDLAAAFLRGLAESAELTVHVRLLEGEDSAHVLEAIFRALGIALAEATERK